MSGNKKTSLLIVLCAFYLIGTATPARAQLAPEILGVKLGMNKEAARQRLHTIGKLEKEERKQQEVWVLHHDPHYSHLIVAFNKNYTQVRFITAKARSEGSRIRYDEVLDVKKAQQTVLGNNYKYVLEVRPAGDSPGYTITAQGTHPQYLTYYSVETVD